ncbi:MAG: biosynthetic arginine decarboxylase [Magnetococcus sp. WYHC-3]
MNPLDDASWSIGQSRDLFRVAGWGAGFFDINDDGHVSVTPLKGEGPSLDIMAIVEELDRRGADMPVLIRFLDILRVRLIRLADSFANAKRQYGFKGRYRPVYPIKVNQQKQVVETLVDAGLDLGLGLEAGSKPELQIVLAMHRDPAGLIICNGYKDEGYMRLALMAAKMGREIFIVVEKPEELFTLLDVAQELGVRPHIGLRVRLEAKGSGKWESSGGQFSKFGLSAMEVLDAVNELRDRGMQDCVRLLHFHMGSQITEIRTLKPGLLEVGRFYGELYRMGCPIQYVDVGGGLGVDYEGGQNNGFSSVNYSLQEYADDVVGYITQVCDGEGLPHPDILTESGRALTAHHALLVIKVREVARHEPCWSGEGPDPGDCAEVRELHTLLSGLTPENARASWNDALQLEDDIQMKFTLGMVGLDQRARGERLFLEMAMALGLMRQREPGLLPSLTDLDGFLVEQYFCNFSVFQSLPDSWAIDQLFPVMPLHRLNERPTRRATIQDVTCDSDGCIDRFIAGNPVKNALELHVVRPGQPYMLGIFLAGAYQEILGDLHNLFGDTNVADIVVNDRLDGFMVRRIQSGELVRDVLRYVDYDPEEMVRQVTLLTRQAVASQAASSDGAKAFIRAFAAALNDYTYLDTVSD